MHEDAVYGLAVDPISEDVFASACDDGKVHIYDLRAPATEGWHLHHLLFIFVLSQAANRLCFVMILVDLKKK